MSEYFEADFFLGNRARLQDMFTGTAPIVLTANGLMQKAADETYRFRQDSNFWYLTGIDEPNVILVIDKGKEYLIVPELSHAREMFDGAIDTNALAKISGVKEVVTEKEGWKRLNSRLKRAGTVAVIAPNPSYVEHLGMYSNPARRRLTRQLKKINPKLELLDLKQHLQRLRMIKQPAEIEATKKAIEITATALKKIERKFNKGAYDNEFAIELDLTRYFVAGGARGHGFDPIVAGGSKSTQVHSMSNDAPVDESKPMLLDVGADFEHYAADITRCWAIKPTKRYQQVYDSVAEVADHAMALLKPGVVLHEYEQTIEHFMGEKLRGLGLIKTIDSESVRHYFPHMTSHFLGLDVHDFGDYDTGLKPGAIVTVEPGIYIPEEGIGIRIEDDILITEDGHINLSASLPRSLS